MKRTSIPLSPTLATAMSGRADAAIFARSTMSQEDARDYLATDFAKRWTLGTCGSTTRQLHLVGDVVQISGLAGGRIPITTMREIWAIAQAWASWLEAREQVGNGPKKWQPGSATVDVMFEAPSDEQGWNGHLVIVTEPVAGLPQQLIDLDLQQFSRAEKGICLPEAVALPWSGVAGEWSGYEMNGCVVAYSLHPEVQSYTHGDWTFEETIRYGPVREAISRIIRQVAA
jgi:hypothetical protein